MKSLVPERNNILQKIKTGERGQNNKKPVKNNNTFSDRKQRKCVHIHVQYYVNICTCILEKLFML